jgi:hypothetical protein
VQDTRIEENWRSRALDKVISHKSLVIFRMFSWLSAARLDWWGQLGNTYNIVACRSKPEYLNQRPAIARQRLGNQVSCIIFWVTNTLTRQCIPRRLVSWATSYWGGCKTTASQFLGNIVRRCESTEVFSWTDKLDPSRCSSPVSKGFSEEDGWLSLRTVKGEITRWGAAKKTPDRRCSEQSKVKL